MMMDWFIQLLVVDDAYSVMISDSFGSQAAADHTVNR